MESVASSERRNESREPNQRKKHGHRTDILFKCFKGEIGCSEVGKKAEGDAGTKESKELRLKVPKMLKDQMCRLVQICSNQRHQLVTIGFVMMGLKMRAVVLDNPSTYICRIHKTSPMFFPASEEDISSKLGALLSLVLQIKQMACSTLDVLNTRQPIQNTGYEDWIDQPEQLSSCIASPKLSNITLF